MRGRLPKFVSTRPPYATLPASPACTVCGGGKKHGARLLDEREEQLASRYLKQRAAWRKRVAALEKRQQREDSTQRVGSRRSRDVRDAGMFALDGGNSLNLARFGGALLSDLEEKQVMEMLAERERREAVRQATIMTATVAQLPPEVREAQKVM